jgi:nucleotide-binding universal stress UspA family protein
MSEIVVGVDESEGAAEALRWAAREADLHDRALTAVMAWGFLDQHHPSGGEPFDPSYGEKDAADALDTIVVAALGADRAGGVGRRAVCDLPAAALLDASHDADLLVVGARGLGGFRGLLLGSVSQHCLHHATSPVAIVRRDVERVADGVQRVERVVVAVDGSAVSRRALTWAAEEARLRDATLQVVNAWRAPYVDAYPGAAMPFDIEAFEEASEDTIEAAVSSLGPGQLPARVQRISHHGGAAAAILDVAKGADLVVMGSRGLGGLKAALLGSVTNQVTHHASCPVVVIPDTGDEAAAPPGR